MVELFGFTFHLYGFILGLSVCLGWWLAQKKAQHLGVDQNEIEKRGVVVLLGGLIGARLYHVATDWMLYQDRWFDTFKIWEGGLSIIGAILGGGVALVVFNKARPSKLSTLSFLDLAVFGLPFSQALGRLGNWVNQELYGWPTTLPWAITIDQVHRLPGLENFESFHPLFAYEALAMVLFGVAMWWWDQRSKNSGVGTGRYFGFYVWYYAGTRFLLDFLRPDKTLVDGIGLGTNQVVLLIIWITLTSWGFVRWKRKYEKI